jgi:hypothetical protein
VRVGVGLVVHREDLPEHRPCPGVALELVVDRLDGAAECGQVLVAGLDEPRASPAEDGQVSLFLVLAERELPEDNAGTGLSQRVLLAWCQRLEQLSVDHHSHRLRPEGDVGGDSR